MRPKLSNDRGDGGVSADEVSRVMAHLGRRGGVSRSEAKLASNRKNLQKALAAKKRLRGHLTDPDAQV